MNCGVLEGLGAVPPALGNHDALGIAEADGFGEGLALVWTRGGDDRLRTVVLLDKGMEQGDRQVRTGGTDHDQLSVRVNRGQRDRLEVGALSRDHRAVDGPHATPLNEAAPGIGFRLGKGIVDGDVGRRLWDASTPAWS